MRRIIIIFISIIMFSCAGENTPIPVPTSTPIPVPTSTPIPVPTSTPIPVPTSTPIPVPTSTPIPVPTSTPIPVPTSTPIIEKVTVNIIDFGFWNSNITIDINSIIVWTNNDSSTHTATSLDSKFDSGYLSSSGKYSYKFTESGTYNYKCSLHSNMRGKIRVLPENGILIDPSPAMPDDPQPSPPPSSYY